MGIFNGMVEWTKGVFAPYGVSGLFALAFIESSFFPVPPDILLILLCLMEPEKALWFALVCTVGSTLGGMFGYFIGWFGGKPVLEKLFSKDKVQKVHEYFSKYEVWAVFIAGFTPIPYKVFTISGGVFYINFPKFVLASVTSRGLRFYLEAILIMLYGQWALNFIDKYFDVLSVLAVAALILVFVLYQKIKRGKSSGK